MIIDENNLGVAEAAIRDILFLFQDLISSYGGFGHGADSGSFDPFAFAQLEFSEPKGHPFGIDIEFLAFGSAIAVICAVSDAWDESDPKSVKSSEYFQRIKHVLDDGGFSSFPDLRKTLILGLSDESEFRASLPRVYGKYVAGYFGKPIDARR